MLVRSDDGTVVIKKDWGPTLIGSGYVRPGPMNCRNISWDMQRLQTSMVRKFKPTLRERLIDALRLERTFEL
jgi:hypothetical protein